MGDSAHEQSMDMDSIYDEWGYFDDCVKNKAPFVMIERKDDTYSEVQYMFRHIEVSEEISAKINEDIGKMYKASLKYYRLPAEKVSFTTNDHSGRFIVRSEYADYFSNKVINIITKILKNEEGEK